MRVFTEKDSVYVMAGHSSTHKQGKLPKDIVLNTIAETHDDYELDKEHTKAVIEIYDPKRKSDYKTYPNFWIKKIDVSKVSDVHVPPSGGPEPIIPPDIEVISFSKAGDAFVYLMVWIRELWK